MSNHFLLTHDLFSRTFYVWNANVNVINNKIIKTTVKGK